MSLATLDERRSMLFDAGEEFHVLGARSFTGRWDAVSNDVLGVRSSNLGIVAVHEDIEHVHVEDCVWRGNSPYIVRDIVPDERRGFSRIVISSENVTNG